MAAQATEYKLLEIARANLIRIVPIMQIARIGTTTIIRVHRASELYQGGGSAERPNM
jgi:hypothetical protein